MTNRCVHGVWLADHCYQCNGSDPETPVAAQSVSAPDVQAFAEQWEALTRNNIYTCPRHFAEAYAREYAFSSNAALQKELEYVQGRRDQAETWMSELGAQIREERKAAEAKVAALEEQIKTRDKCSFSGAMRNCPTHGESKELTELRDSRDRLQEALRQIELLSVNLTGACFAIWKRARAALGDPEREGTE